jgi:hypothetical protein
MRTNVSSVCQADDFQFTSPPSRPAPPGHGSAPTSLRLLQLRSAAVSMLDSCVVDGQAPLRHKLLQIPQTQAYQRT